MKNNKHNTLKRVKVYFLTDVWVDNGTGYCFAEISENQEPYLIVKNELDESDELLRTKIEGTIQFQRQQETLIVWSDASGQNIALSFQERAGCASLCHFLIKINRDNLAPLISLVYVIPSEPEGCEVTEFITGPINFPTEDPKLDDLSDVFQKLNENPSSSYQRDCIVKFSNKNDYIKKLTILFHEAEESRKIRSLHILCNIVKTLILFNEVSIIETILEDEIIMDVVGMLEYDPDFPLHKANHRSYLRNDLKFKEIQRIKVENIKLLIIKHFKLQFLKDVVLARLLDDPTFNFISTLVHYNHVEILQFLDKSNFLDELFNVYTQEGNLQKKRDGIKLVHQFIIISKNLQPHQKSNLYKGLVKKGLLKMLSFVLHDDSIELRVLSTEILISIIEHDVLLVSTSLGNDEDKNESEKSLVKKGKLSDDKPEAFNPDDYENDNVENFSVEDMSAISVLNYSLSDDMTLLSMLTDFLLADNASGLRMQAFEALKTLLDPVNNLNAPNPISEQLFVEQLETESYFSAFYSKVAPKLFRPLIDVTSEVEIDGNLEIIDKRRDDLLIHLCELINFCTKDESVSRSFFLENHILLGISKLISSNHKLQLKLASIRSLKSIILLNDEYYIRYIISNDLMKNVFELFEIHQESETLVYSSVLDLLESLLTEIDSNGSKSKTNFKLLSEYIVKNFKPILEKITTVQSGIDFIAYVETGETRKRNGNADLSLDFDESLNDSAGQEEYSNDDQESDYTSDSDNGEEQVENKNNDSHEKVNHEIKNESNGKPKLNKVLSNGKENIKEKRVREDDVLSMKYKVSPKKKTTLKSKITHAGKKFASKFSTK